MNSLQSELVRLGFVSKNSDEQRQKRVRIQADRRNKKGNRKAIGLNPRNRFASVKEFLESLPKRLKKPSDLREVLRDAHWVADDLGLAKDKRRRLHSFLCRMGEEMNGKEPSVFEEFLRTEIRKY